MKRNRRRQLALKTPLDRALDRAAAEGRARMERDRIARIDRMLKGEVEYPNKRDVEWRYD